MVICDTAGFQAARAIFLLSLSWTKHFFTQVFLLLHVLYGICVKSKDDCACNSQPLRSFPYSDVNNNCSFLPASVWFYLLHWFLIAWLDNCMSIQGSRFSYSVADDCTCTCLTFTNSMTNGGIPVVWLKRLQMLLLSDSSSWQPWVTELLTFSPAPPGCSRCQ